MAHVLVTWNLLNDFRSWFKCSLFEFYFVFCFWTTWAKSSIGLSFNSSVMSCAEQYTYTWKLDHCIQKDFYQLWLPLDLIIFSLSAPTMPANQMKVLSLLQCANYTYIIYHSCCIQMWICMIFFSGIKVLQMSIIIHHSSAHIHFTAPFSRCFGFLDYFQLSKVVLNLYNPKASNSLPLCGLFIPLNYYYLLKVWISLMRDWVLSQCTMHNAQYIHLISF